MTDPIDPTEPKIKHPRGLTYRGDHGTLSVYDFWLRGRPVLEVIVDNEDPELKVWIAKPGGAEVGDMLVTKGVATMTSPTAKVVVDEDTEGLSVDFGDGPKMLDAHSIRYYVEPRLAVLIARVFVPGDVYANTSTD